MDWIGRISTDRRIPPNQRIYWSTLERDCSELRGSCELIFGYVSGLVWNFGFSKNFGLAVPGRFQERSGNLPQLELTVTRQAYIQTSPNAPFWVFELFLKKKQKVKVLSFFSKAIFLLLIFLSSRSRSETFISGGFESRGDGGKNIGTKACWSR